MKRIKENKLDEVFSKLVRGRTAYNCESNLEKCPNGQAQCSHLFGRRSRNTRFAPDNAACHCSYCHRYFTENPYEFGKWIVGHMGEKSAEELELRAHTTLKRSQPEIRDLLDKMKSELKRMEALRNQGETGRIEFSL